MPKAWIFLLLVSQISLGQESLRDIALSRNIELRSFDTTENLLLKELAFKATYGSTPQRLIYNNLTEKIDSSKLRHWHKTATAATYKEPLLTYLEPDFFEYTASRAFRFHPGYHKLAKFQNFYRWLSRYEPEQFILINIAANTLTFYRNQHAEFEMKVIVGTKKNRTPIMATKADALMLYPYWTATRNIAVNEILPKVKTDSTYLLRNNFQVLDQNMEIMDPSQIAWDSINTSNFRYKFRQGTGCDNALGLLKINIKNPYSIYMHDVPHTAYSKSLFQRDRRFFSHGCIRLEDPVKLANSLEPSEIIDKALMESCLANQKPKVIELKKETPVFIMYFTDYIDSQGSWQKAGDYYGLEQDDIYHISD